MSILYHQNKTLHPKIPYEQHIREPNKQYALFIAYSLLITKAQNSKFPLNNLQATCFLETLAERWMSQLLMWIRKLINASWALRDLRLRRRERRREGVILKVLAPKHESRILRQRSNPVSGSRKSKASSLWAKQHRAGHIIIRRS